MQTRLRHAETRSGVTKASTPEQIRRAKHLATIYAGSDRARSRSRLRDREIQRRLRLAAARPRPAIAARPAQPELRSFGTVQPQPPEVVDFAAGTPIPPSGSSPRLPPELFPVPPLPTNPADAPRPAVARPPVLDTKPPEPPMPSGGWLLQSSVHPEARSQDASDVASK